VSPGETLPLAEWRLQVPHLAGKLLAAMAIRVFAGLAYRTLEPSITGTC
jgi:hypothetical protein